MLANRLLENASHILWICVSIFDKGSIKGHHHRSLTSGVGWGWGNMIGISLLNIYHDMKGYIAQWWALHVPLLDPSKWYESNCVKKKEKEQKEKKKLEHQNISFLKYLKFHSMAHVPDPLHLMSSIMDVLSSVPPTKLHLDISVALPVGTWKTSSMLRITKSQMGSWKKVQLMVGIGK